MKHLLSVALLVSGLIVVYFLGAVITIGERLATLTHQPWVEIVFYLLLLYPLYRFLLRPLYRLYHTPELPSLQGPDSTDPAALKQFGLHLAQHCDYIPDETVRQAHQRGLRESVTSRYDAESLQTILSQELTLRLQGQPAMQVMGIEAVVRLFATRTFMATAISPNSKIDGLSVIVLGYSMLSAMVTAAGFRPTHAQLAKLSWHVVTTAVLSWWVSESLHNIPTLHPFHDLTLPSLGDGTSAADVSDVDTGDVSDGADVADATDLDPELSSGFSLTALIRHFPVPGFLVGAAADGAANALLMLRIGYVARAYLVQGAAAFDTSDTRRAIKQEAVISAIRTLPSTILNGSKTVGGGMWHFFSLFFKSRTWKRYASQQTH